MGLSCKPYGKMKSLMETMVPLEEKEKEKPQKKAPMKKK